MPYCDNCGTKLRAKAKFCPNCATKVGEDVKQINQTIPAKQVPFKQVSAKRVPTNIESYLTSNEKLLETSKSREWEIFVTDKRVLFHKNNIFGNKELIEASYKHISSIEYKKENPLLLIILGIFCFIIGYLFYYFVPIVNPDASIVGTISLIFYIILGIVAIVSAFFQQPKFKIHVVGREPLTLTGNLEPIIKIIRQYKEAVDIGS